MTGKELAAIRKAAGLNQTELARRAGIGRNAVSYWECKAHVKPRAGAVVRMAKVLDFEGLIPVNRARGGWGIRHMAEPAQREARVWGTVKITQRMICGAKTRKGTRCRCKPEPGKHRCKFHGGRSTGPKTPEGRTRISEAQKRRWARWRETHRKLDILSHSPC